ncbi:GIY-YIG nuclease family protein [Polynucleobacter paneuropaeus]|uniref:Excinuclease cho n=1 Tax=Polynucleobacter paneuropaeus TaxID=2527775 RepID=A0AAE2YK91_9BURK|nr:GIY-YIG nuclease family protein [Polynucleobacter paneuropaeus]MBT8591113.1 GIY-YIG nuclease family protein [Polynucleobacter paneuropaeus]MBT8596504.1 GIY-YIG nuclease family protein [Polynucleobacter paneuropaeus]MBT8598317.1 GIY-YIG nuclease family protein [Polynucleobacter paneuropaeus]
MNSQRSPYPDLAFVDIETTGSHFDRDRITEIGIKTLAGNQIYIWEKLIDPQTYIPQNIQRLTGISPSMVQGQPCFSELAEDLNKELEGKIFVAHNARFDYGFIKASFKRVGIDFKPKVLCTVKLSRLLFPDQPRHNLDTIISTHGLKVSARHRALGDADLLLQFWRVCESRFGQEKLNEAINQLIGNASLPPNIDQGVIDSIPDGPGCYIFYGENKTPLYIGKSISLRSRVMGHFQGALTQRKEMKLSLQVRDIDWIETSGELGALILESRLIKERIPSLNIKLRKSKDLCAWSLAEDVAGILVPSLVTHHHLAPGLQDNLYGLFYSKREAYSYLKAVAKKYHLCEALLGLERRIEGKSCFGYQVKQCSGTCINLASIALHNLQLKTAMELFKVQVWPYSGAIAIKEGGQMIVVDKWCYLGTAINQDELYELAQSGDAEFDLDIYKIVKKALSGAYRSQVIQIGADK